jgi:hypothetical protein
MSTIGGPNLVDSGLILELDAGNTKSYPGTGTTWFDKSGNAYNGTLTNGPTFDTGSLGSIVFDGIDDYVNLGNVLDITTGSYSVSFWTYVNSSPTSFQTIFAKKGVAAANSGYAVYYNGSTKKLMWSNANGVTTQEYYTVSTIPLDSWINIVKIRDVDASTKGTFYINGQLYPITSNPTGLNVSNSYNLTFHRASNSSTYYFSGKTAISTFYNRALSDSEVLQNYNALKGRFGL